MSMMEQSTGFNAMGDWSVDSSGHQKAVAELGEDVSVERGAAQGTDEHYQ